MVQIRGAQRPGSEGMGSAAEDCRGQSADGGPARPAAGYLDHIDGVRRRLAVQMQHVAKPGSVGCGRLSGWRRAGLDRTPLCERYHKRHEQLSNHGDGKPVGGRHLLCGGCPSNRQHKHQPHELYPGEPWYWPGRQHISCPDYGAGLQRWCCHRNRSGPPGSRMVPGERTGRFSQLVTQSDTDCG